MKGKSQMFMRVLCMVSGSLLMLYVAIMAGFVRINSGMIITFSIGALCALIGAFLPKLHKIYLLRWASVAFGGGCVFVVAMIVFLCVYGAWDTVDYREDAVIVLGAGIVGEQVTSPLAYRLDMCLDYIQKNPDALIVVSGGQGIHEEIPEALAMKRYLVARGVSEGQIMMESRATNTGENLKFSKQLLDAHFQSSYRIAIITNQFHIFRAHSLAKIAGYQDATHLHAGLDFYNVPVSYIREVFGVLKLWVLQR